MSKRTAGIIYLSLAVFTAGSGLFALSYGGYIGTASAPWNRFLGQVGVTLGVAPNPYNTLNEQLNAKQLQLDEQATDLAAREAALNEGSATSSSGITNSPVVGYLAIAIGILAFFVGLNFILDWRRLEMEKRALARLAPAGAAPLVDDVEPPRG